MPFQQKQRLMPKHKDGHATLPKQQNWRPTPRQQNWRRTPRQQKGRLNIGSKSRCCWLELGAEVAAIKAVLAQRDLEIPLFLPFDTVDREISLPLLFLIITITTTTTAISAITFYLLPRLTSHLTALLFLKLWSRKKRIRHR